MNKLFGAFCPPKLFFRGLIYSLPMFFFGGYSTLIPYYFWASSLFLAMSSASSSLLIIILIAFLFCLGNIIYLAFIYYLDPPFYCGFLSYLTRSAYLRVLRVFSDDAEDGETLPIITVLQKPTKLSFRTIVSLLPLKGVWPFPWSNALIHYFRLNKLLFIYAPSILVCLSMSIWSAPLSLPARSIKEIFPKSFFPSFKEI